MFPNLFLSRYTELKGRDWLRRIEPEDRAVFVDIGLKANGHGQLGGKAVVKKYGKEHLSRIGRIGAIATNSIKAWNRALQEELNRELGVTFDF
jgi:hypothetical protein